MLKIDDPGFQDFRSDADCQIRLQSVIGEKLVECLPTQPRPKATPPPPLRRSRTADGAGQYLLPVEQHVTPVGEDLIRNVMRLPYRQRFAIILNEFGVGPRGPRQGPAQVIRGANPALRELDKVLAILATQNKCWPTARDSATGAGASGRESAVGQRASSTRPGTTGAGDRRARRRSSRTSSCSRSSCGAEADDGAARRSSPPQDAGDARPARRRRRRSTRCRGARPVLARGLPAFQTLGDPPTSAARRCRRRSRRSELRRLHARREAVRENLAKLLTSLRDEDGIERLMDLIYYIASRRTATTSSATTCARRCWRAATRSRPSRPACTRTSSRARAARARRASATRTALGSILPARTRQGAARVRAPADAPSADGRDAARRRAADARRQPQPEPARRDRQRPCSTTCWGSGE